jgi:hypothetical protein
MDSEHAVIDVPRDALTNSATRDGGPTATPPRRPRRASRLLVIYGFVLATLAVAALVLGALSLLEGAKAQQDIRDEERQQTTCERALVVATGVSPQQKQLIDALNACFKPLAK